MTEIILFEPGARGHFMRSLCAAIKGDPRLVIEGAYSEETGDAHMAYYRILRGTPEPPTWHVAIKTMLAAINGNNYIGVSHYSGDLDMIRNDYPNIRIIRIYFEGSDEFEARVMACWKLFAQPTFKAGGFKQKFIANPPMSHVRGQYFYKPEYEDDPNILQIRYADIMNDKEKVLQQLSEFYDKPIPDLAYDVYDRYSKVQAPYEEIMDKIL